MVDLIGAFYIEIDTKLSWSIELGAICDENHTKQWRDRSYKCSICFHDTKWSWSIASSADIDENQIGQLIVQMRFTPKTKLNSHDQSDQLQSMTKTSKDNNMIEHIGLVYTETKIFGNYLNGRSLWWKPEKTKTWSILQVHSMSKMILNFHDRLDWV